MGELLTLVRKDQQRRSRRQRFGKGLGKGVQALLTGFLLSLAAGWEFMLVVGVIHAEWIPQLPTIGYWWAVLIAWLLRTSLIRVPQSTSKKEADR